jgi:hypothetical protein
MHFRGGSKDAMTPFAAAYPHAAAQADIQIHPGLDHFGAGRDRQVERACLEWLIG